MKSVSLKILTVGDRKVPAEWFVSQRVKIQRLYYIKGGTGSMNDSHGGRIPFEKGKIYIQPYNFEAQFTSDPNDPIDHVYYDFLSTPPIISNKPIVYSPQTNSTATSDKFGYVPPHLLNKDSKFGHIFRGILSTLLMTLSFEKELPFSEDAMIVEALDTIRKNYMKAVSVSELAAAAGFDVHYFIRRFKSIMGMTPYAYLRSYRLIKAAELIESGMSIAETSERVGYESPTALSRALKKDGLK